MIDLDPTSPEPPFEQVKARVTELVATGELAPGDKLPTVRGLAQQLGIAPNTVARSYRELEAAGVVDTRGRSGTFVSGDRADSAAREAAAAYVTTLRSLGRSRAQAIELVERTWDVRRD
jgi:DNA-binding transcriptional regulator YhcF (GntR family)